MFVCLRRGSASTEGCKNSGPSQNRETFTDDFSRVSKLKAGGCIFAAYFMAMQYKGLLSKCCRLG